MDIYGALHPHDPEAFLRDYWRRQPLAIERRIPGYYDDVLTLVQLEEILVHSRIRYPELRVTKEAEKVSKEKLMQWGWLDKIVPLDKKPGSLTPLYEAYSNGYSLFLRAERACPSIAAFCRQFDEWLHHQAIGEVVLTPGESQGSIIHTDRHDVFAIQICGSKHWRVYEPPEGDDSSRPLGERVGAPLVDRCMHPGDLLYVPKEYPHEAVNAAGTPSLHLSVAVYPTRWKDLMLESLKAVMNANPAFNEPLPARFLTDSPTTFADQFYSLWNTAAGQADLCKSLEQFGAELCFSLRPLATDHFADLTRLKTLDADSLLERRPGMLCHLARNGKTVKVAFPGNFMNLPLGIYPTLSAIAHRSGPFRPKELPGKLDDNSRVLLMKSLIKAGLIRFALAS
jgi:hypothetical protein